MFARSAVSCEGGGGCSADFIDRCQSCTLSLCGVCLENHACTPYAHPIPYVTFDGLLVEATPPSKERFVYTPLTRSNFSLASSSSSATSTSSSSSATSTSSSSSLTKSVTNFDAPIAKKRKTAAAVLVREPISYIGYRVCIGRACMIFKTHAT